MILEKTKSFGYYCTMVFKGKLSPEMSAYCLSLLTSEKRSMGNIANELGISAASVLRIQRTFRSGPKRNQVTNNSGRCGPKEKL